MKTTTILLSTLSMLAMLALSGCQHVSGSGQVRTKSGSISVNTAGSSGQRSSGKFCPPGQAKKGRC